MKFEYTLAELSTAISALEQVYGKVSVLDPYRGTVLDPATLQPTDKAEELTALDETGRGVQLAQADDGPELVLYQGIQADARPCVLAFHCCMPHNLQSSAGAENSFNRVLAQMQEELRRDYLTGVYNARYLDTEYRRYAEPQAQAGLAHGPGRPDGSRRVMAPTRGRKNRITKGLGADLDQIESAGGQTFEQGRGAGIGPGGAAHPGHAARFPGPPGRGQKALGPGKTFEFDIRGFANHTVGAVSTDHIAGAHVIGLPFAFYSVSG